MKKKLLIVTTAVTLLLGFVSCEKESITPADQQQTETASEYTTRSSVPETPVVTPYPALEYGQTMLIEESHPLWEQAMEQAEIVRKKKQADLDNNPGGEPDAYQSCSGNVCCETSWTLVNGVAVYVTYCWNRSTGDEIDRIVQW